MEEFPHWRELGTELGVSEGGMYEIESDYQYTAQRRTALLQKWFYRHEHVCWEHITDSLRAIKQNRKAREIENKYIVTTIH